MRRREKPTGEAAGACWWDYDRDTCIAAYWRWKHRRWLLSDSTPASPPMRVAEKRRRICIALHGVDPEELGPPPGMDQEGRIVDQRAYHAHNAERPRPNCRQRPQ